MPGQTFAYVCVSKLDQDLDKNKADILKLTKEAHLGHVSFKELREIDTLIPVEANVKILSPFFSHGKFLLFEYDYTRKIYNSLISTIISLTCYSASFFDNIHTFSCINQKRR
jgi:hypothetical protein